MLLSLLLFSFIIVLIIHCCWINIYIYIVIIVSNIHEYPIFWCCCTPPCPSRFRCGQHLAMRRTPSQYPKTMSRLQCVARRVPEVAGSLESRGCKWAAYSGYGPRGKRNLWSLREKSGNHQVTRDEQRLVDIMYAATNEGQTNQRGDACISWNCYLAAESNHMFRVKTV